ncbi:MAG: 2-hydroxy-3-oxopropionate reductase [Anaerolineales bacterium]|nr:2-hydroxy-3-oxopropionate reductase [Anaerolineales bacterium]
MNIGFIGLGIMGKPMAKNLIAAGHALAVYDINDAPVRELEKMGAKAGSSAADAASGCALIITMLPNSPQVKEAVLGENGVIHGAKAGSILVDMSSIAPRAAQDIAAELAKKGIEMLDAPVSGGEPKAIDGTLAIMAGGKPEVFDKVKDVLLEMGSSAVLCGGIGAGNIVKLANQIIVALNIAAVSEAFTLAAKAGVDPQAVFSAIKGGLAGSTVLNAKAPMVLEGNYKPGFRIELHIKDLQNALDTAHELGVPVPLTSQIMEIMQALRVDGKQKDDHGGIIQFYERLAGVKVRGGGWKP